MLGVCIYYIFRFSNSTVGEAVARVCELRRLLVLLLLSYEYLLVVFANLLLYCCRVIAVCTKQG